MVSRVLNSIKRHDGSVFFWRLNMIDGHNLRTLPLYNESEFFRITQNKIAVLGLGGVGCAVCEALCRFGFYKFLLLDSDKFCASNLNRQLFATSKTLGHYKCEVAKSRLLEINPDCEIDTLTQHYDVDSKDEIFNYNLNFVADCIDTLTSKIILASECQTRRVPIISCLGTGNRTDPSKFKIGPVEQTKGCGCPLARAYRRECRKHNLTKIDVLYSVRLPQKISAENSFGRHIPASSPFCPPVAGFLIACHIVDRLLL